MEQQFVAVSPPGYTYSTQQHPGQVRIITQQPQYAVQDQGCCSGRREKYPSTCGVVLGSILLAAGILCVIFSITAICLSASVTNMGTGIYTGVFFIITGSLTVAAGKGQHTGLVISSMVLAIISAALFVPSLLTASAVGMAYDLDPYDPYHGRSYDYDDQLPDYRRNEYDWQEYPRREHHSYHPEAYATGGGLNGVQLALSVIILGITIAISILGCLGLCRSKGISGHVIMPQQLQMAAATGQYPGHAMAQPMEKEEPAPPTGKEKSDKEQLIV